MFLTLRSYIQKIDSHLNHYNNEGTYPFKIIDYVQHQNTLVRANKYAHCFYFTNGRSGSKMVLKFPQLINQKQKGKVERLLREDMDCISYSKPFLYFDKKPGLKGNFVRI